MFYGQIHQYDHWIIFTLPIRFLQCLINNKFETCNKLLGYLLTGRYKEAYKDFINNFNDEGIGEKIKVYLSDGLLCELEQKLENIRNNYSIKNSEEIFA